MWSKRQCESKKRCFDCKRDIEIGEEELICTKHKGRITPGVDPYYEVPYCLDCGEEKQKKEQEKHELEIKQKASECLSELRQLWDNLEPKVENEDLNVADCQRICALKNKISELLKTPNTEDFLTYWEVKIDFDTLRKSLTDLDNFINDYASPQTQDKVSGDKNRNRKANRTCQHENIELYEDDPSNYCCSYCWDDKSEEFLAVLARKGIKQGEKTPNTPNNNPSIEKEKQKLQQAITNLTNNPNKTPQEEQELTDKQEQLDKLTNPTNANNNSWLIPTLIIGGGILLVGLVIFLTKNKKIKH